MKWSDTVADHNWNDTEKGILKRMLRGLNAVDAIKEQRFVEGIIGLLIGLESYWQSVVAYME